MSSELLESTNIKARALIDEHYAKLTSAKIIEPRAQQIALSKQIALSLIKSVLNEDHLEDVLLSEAPTGTGKSIAYLIGSLAARAVLPSKVQVLVATATKALQSQLKSKDVPKLVDAGIVSESKIGIAKGKSNYICLKRANETLDNLKKFEEDPEEVMLDDHSLPLSVDQVDTLLDAYDKHLWDGDFDNFNHFKLKTNKALCVVGDLCNPKSCPYINSCAYFKAIDSLSICDLIITNHDLMLRDLQLQAEGGTSNLGKQAPSYMLIVDEAHNLPDKAIAVGQTEGRLSHFYDSLPKIKGALKLIGMSSFVSDYLRNKAKVSDLDFRLTRDFVDQPLLDLIEAVSMLTFDSDNNCRFKQGVISKEVIDAMAALKLPLEELISVLEAITKGISDIPSMDYTKNSVIISDLTRRITDVKNVAVPLDRVLADYLNGNSMTAKWANYKGDRVVIYSSPLEGAEVLEPLLWHPEESKVKAVSMISATISDVNGFNRFASKSGIDFEYTNVVLPYIFPYKDSNLVVVGMKHTPKFAERKLFEQELSHKLVEHINPEKGVLVIFHSWAMLEGMVPHIRKALGTWAKVFVQGESTINYLVEEHCRTIDAGQGSILVGVASMAEGLDLPGKYCEEVHIPALPFASPTGPVEQEVSERLGSEYFNKRALPDATTALIQTAGRLLRRETDRGSIFIYDRRLVSTNYGSRILSALPPFNRIIEPI